MKFATLTFFIIQIVLSIVAAPTPNPNPDVLDYSGDILRDGAAGTFNIGKTWANAFGSVITGTGKLAANTIIGASKIAKSSVGLALAGTGRSVQLTGNGLSMFGSGVSRTADIINNLSVQQIRDTTVNGVTAAAQMGTNVSKKAAETALYMAGGVGNLAKNVVGSTLTGTGNGIEYTGNTLNSIGDNVSKTGELVKGLTAEQIRNSVTNRVSNAYQTGQNSVNGASNLVRDIVGGAVNGIGQGFGTTGDYLQTIGNNMARTANTVSATPEKITDSFSAQFSF